MERPLIMEQTDCTLFILRLHVYAVPTEARRGHESPGATDNVVLGTELWSFGGATSAPNHLSVSPAPGGSLFLRQRKRFKEFYRQRKDL